MEMCFGKYYLVKKEAEDFYAVYDLSCTPKKLLTHKQNWRQATKLAKLLQQAYHTGYNDARDIYDENAHRY